MVVLNVFFSICNRASKIPLLTNVIQTMHKAMHKKYSEQSTCGATEARIKVGHVCEKLESSVEWNRKQRGGIDLSIIVPFYKTEKYARRCIESILGQQHGYSVEIILVDDGSPDKCGQILDTYTDRENVIVIHQKNAGVSAARNAGLMRARGEYILFVDSDDMLLTSAISVLMDTAKEYDADIVEGGYYTFSDKGKRKEYIHQFDISTKGAHMYGYPWGKVIRSRLFDSICFPEGYRYEDTIIPYLVFPNANITVCVPQLITAYYINKEGLTSQTRLNVKCIDTLYIIEMLLDHYEKCGKDLPENLLRGTLYQLGPYLFFRTKGLGQDLQEKVFILAAELALKHGVCEIIPNNYYENELICSLRDRQYKRWKWASVLL